VRARKNKNITKKDPLQQPHHGLDKNITTEEARPTGVPTLSGQVRVRAERAEQRTEQRSAAARANAPVEEAH
jgi:hypothetical protein